MVDHSQRAALDRAGGLPFLKNSINILMETNLLCEAKFLAVISFPYDGISVYRSMNPSYPSSAPPKKKVSLVGGGGLLTSYIFCN
jgi:hypothetical protein